MRPVRFLPAARAEFLEVLGQLASQDPTLALDFLAEAERALLRVGTFPEHGSPFLGGTRRVLLRRFPFSIVYSNEADELLAVAVAHHRRRPGYWLARIR